MLKIVFLTIVMTTTIASAQSQDDIEQQFTAINAAHIAKENEAQREKNEKLYLEQLEEDNRLAKEEILKNLRYEERHAVKFFSKVIGATPTGIDRTLLVEPKIENLDTGMMTAKISKRTYPTANGNICQLAQDTMKDSQGEITRIELKCFDRMKNLVLSKKRKVTENMYGSPTYKRFGAGNVEDSDDLLNK